jgi:hypothetical protein
MLPAPRSALITRSRAVHPWRVAGTCDDVEVLLEFHIITPGFSGEDGQELWLRFGHFGANHFEPYL